jgi:hypothetical protein
MPPTPLTFKSLQPFSTVRENWSSLKPYHDNYFRTVSFLSVLTGFVGTLALIIKHGFKFPILHPMMAEDIEPEKHLEHPNEYMSEEDLVEARLFEFEQEERWRLAKEEMERKEQQEKGEYREQEEEEKEDQRKERQGDGEGEYEEDPVTREAEEGLQEQLQDGAENAMDAMDDEEMFDVFSDQDP